MKHLSQKAVTRAEGKLDQINTMRPGTSAPGDAQLRWSQTHAAQTRAVNAAKLRHCKDGRTGETLTSTGSFLTQISRPISDTMSTSAQTNSAEKKQIQNNADAEKVIVDALMNQYINERERAQRYADNVLAQLKEVIQVKQEGYRAISSIA